MSVRAQKMRTPCLWQLLLGELSMGGNFCAGSLCGCFLVNAKLPWKVSKSLKVHLHFELVKCYLKVMSCSFSFWKGILPYLYHWSQVFLFSPVPLLPNPLTLIHWYSFLVWKCSVKRQNVVSIRAAELLLSGFDRRCLNVIGRVMAGTREAHPMQKILLVSHFKCSFTQISSPQSGTQLGQPGVAVTFWLLSIYFLDVLFQFIPSWHFSRSVAHLLLFDRVSGRKYTPKCKGQLAERAAVVLMTMS